MSGYTDGRRVEYAVVHQLREDGYNVTRAASSKGAADVIGIKPGQVVLVNVKRTAMPGPAERADLLLLAGYVDAVPLVALKPARRPLEFRRLTGAGPRDWVPWTSDEAALRPCRTCHTPTAHSQCAPCRYSR